MFWDLNKQKLREIFLIAGMPQVEVSLDSDEGFSIGEMCRSRVCGHRVEGVDCGGEVSEWISLAIGKPNLRLIRQTRSDIGKGKVELSFSSQAQFLMVNANSIQWLVDRLPEGSDCRKETILERFRGNIIVSGAGAFEEENWTRIRIGRHVFEVNF